MDIITDYASRKARASDMAGYVDTLRDPKNRPDIEKVHANLNQCASYLVFNEYFTVDELRLVKAHTCKQHLLCPFCAMRRSGKFVVKNLPKVEQVIRENRARIPAMVTFTVKNGPCLRERFNHLRASHRRLNQRRRDHFKGQKATEWAKVAGGITSYEFTKKDEGDWHPHIHALVMLDDFIDQKALSAEWEEITGDSFIVDVRRIKGRPNAGGLDIASGLLEVCKYALKFHDMSLPDTWHAYQTLRTRRLVDSFGILRGVEVPDNLLDDPLEGLPFIERHYRYRPATRAYDLVEVRNHESGNHAADGNPDSNDRGSAPDDRQVQGSRGAPGGHPVSGVCPPGDPGGTVRPDCRKLPGTAGPGEKLQSLRSPPAGV